MKISVYPADPGPAKIAERRDGRPAGDYKFRAQLWSASEIHAYGKTREEAVGRLVIANDIGLGLLVTQLDEVKTVP